MKTPCGVEIAIGQRWVEVDPRFVRVVVVTGMDATMTKGSGTIGYVQIRNADMPNQRPQWAALQRFNGKRGGYRLEAAQ